VRGYGYGELKGAERGKGYVENKGGDITCLLIMHDARVKEHGHDEGRVLREPVVRELLRRHGWVTLDQRNRHRTAFHWRGT
jgi:hypothetical protein